MGHMPRNGLTFRNRTTCLRNTSIATGPLCVRSLWRCKNWKVGMFRLIVERNSQTTMVSRFWFPAEVSCSNMYIIWVRIRFDNKWFKCQEHNLCLRLSLSLSFTHTHTHTHTHNRPLRNAREKCSLLFLWLIALLSAEIEEGRPWQNLSSIFSLNIGGPATYPEARCHISLIITIKETNKSAEHTAKLKQAYWGYENKSKLYWWWNLGIVCFC